MDDVAKKAQKDALSEYERKRDFEKTGEPRGRKRPPQSRHPRFVIQKHAASSLHYDLRLEIGGALESWAVPKGPSLDPSVKRLAMRTEPHPLEYLEWEGVIPKGSYGAGEMIVWDRGVYENVSGTPLGGSKPGKKMTMEEMLEKGDLKFFLLGDKVKGAFGLFRTSDPGDREQWLLVKKKGEGADARRNPASTQPESVLSGKTIEDLRREAEEG
jgi:DNA ligase D-like protein (predicted 3'-phosphoesterase)